MATLALPLAAVIAPGHQAVLFGCDPARHLARLASRSPPLPIPCMQACTIGWPTVARQFSRACSSESAEARSLAANMATRATKPVAIIPLSDFAASLA